MCCKCHVRNVVFKFYSTKLEQLENYEIIKEMQTVLESKYELADEFSMNAKAQDASISAIRNDEEYACKNSAITPSAITNLENAIKYSNHKGYGETCAKVILLANIPWFMVILQ